MVDETPKTWVLTCSPENYAATRAHAHGVIGVKERNRNRALRIAVGDRIVLYLTRVSSFAASIVVTGELFEQRTVLWPGRTGRADIYPWRFATRPEIVVPEQEWVPAETLADTLDHVAKWPREHWTLAFQGQLRTVSEHDTGVLLARLRAAAGAPAAADARLGAGMRA
ncbi:EVE domain-containing protein [Conexibacter sp. CPCC 206217]|uniref:EVE domain-containing protein n=1 Tax=Conexibacter sp. CPCC 206217 TaxID=3064574 RepID=UPI0027234B8E|nr:EVE domain-containing protein [Conexibacter sp. CPCC 206217]MDO8209379.1 EVE domain-containing protein [Conexibacter sp. CPCC 206217]